MGQREPVKPAVLPDVDHEAVAGDEIPAAVSDAGPHRFDLREIPRRPLALPGDQDAAAGALLPPDQNAAGAIPLNVGDPEQARHPLRLQRAGPEAIRENPAHGAFLRVKMLSW